MMRSFDGHCDTLARCLERGSALRQNTGHVDLTRCAALGQHAQIFAIFADSAAVSEPLHTVAQRQHALLERECARNADLVRRCRTAQDVRAAWAAGKTAALLGIEGAELLACDPGRVAQAEQWGVRIINPVWNRTNALSGTNLEDPDRGLSAQGRDFIREMESCGIYADVSHLSDPGFWDLVRMAHRPILASHSNSRAVCPHRRNLTDDMLRAIRNTGGVVGLNLYQSFVGPDQTMDGLVRQI